MTRNHLVGLTLVFAVTVGTVAGLRIAHDRAQRALFAAWGYNGAPDRWFADHVANVITPGLSRREVRRRVGGFDRVNYYLVNRGGDSALGEQYIYSLPLSDLHVNVYYQNGAVIDADPNDYGVASGRQLEDGEAASWFERMSPSENGQAP